MMGAVLVTDPWFYVLAVPVVLLVGISKGGFGGGAGLVAVPLLSVVMPLPQAAAILLPILCVMDLFAALGVPGAIQRGQSQESVAGRGGRDRLWRGLVRIARRAVAACPRGCDRGRVRVAVGPRNQSARIGRHARGVFWGAVGGFTSTLAHAGGPPVSVHLLPQKLPPALFVGTTVIVFAMFNYLKLIPYGWLGQLSADNLMTSLVLLPLAPVGIRLGRWLLERIEGVVFYRIVYALLLVTGLKLVSEALVY